MKQRGRRFEVRESDGTAESKLFGEMVAEHLENPANRLQVLLAHDMIEMTPNEKLISLKWEFGKELTQSEKDTIIDISKRERK